MIEVPVGNEYLGHGCAQSYAPDRTAGDHRNGRSKGGQPVHRRGVREIADGEDPVPDGGGKQGDAQYTQHPTQRNQLGPP